MKISATITLTIALASGNNAVALHSPKVSTVLPTNAKASVAKSVVKGVPRGGASDGVLGTPIQTKHLVKLYAAFYGLNGALSLPAPEAGASQFPDLSTVGSPAHVAYEHLGAISLGYAILVYQAVFGSLFTSTVKGIGLSGLPLLYVRYRHVLKGTSSKLGGANMTSLVLFFSLLIATWQIVWNGDYAKLAAKCLSAFSLVAGGLAELNPDLGVKVWGLPAMSGSSKAFFIWFSALLLGYGVLSQLLLNGTSGLQAVGYAALLESFLMIDCMYLRKWNVGVAPPESNYVFLGIPLLTALVILLS